MSHCTTTITVLPATNLLFADICPPNYSEKDLHPIWYHSDIHDVTQGVQRDDMESSQDVQSSVINPGDIDTQSSQDVRSSVLNLSDIDTRWKHRVGWPRLLNAPVFTDELTQHDFAKDSSDLEVLESRIKEILGKYEISRRGRDGFHVRYRRQQHHQGKVHFGLLRVLVECVYDPEQQQRHPDSWPLAVIDIHKAIRETVNDPRDIGIELYDGVYEHSIRLSPDLPADCQDFVRNWSGGRNYRQQILDLFENRPNLWQAMLLTGLKASDECTRDHKCVLWFDAINTSNPLWPQLESEIASILPDNIPIEIWQASHAILCNSTSPESDQGELLSGPAHQNPQNEDLDFQRPPKPGSSVGVMANATDAGTLGGYIRVSQDAVDPHGNTTTSERTYGLTNAHVVLGLDPKNFRKLWSKQQLHLPTDPTERLPVQCPSKVDCDDYLEDYNKSIEFCQSRITANKTMLRYLHRDNDADTKVARLEDGISKASNNIHQVMLESRMAREDRYLADVCAVAFGRRSHKCPDFVNRLAMDLALIDVTNSIPDPSAVYPRANKLIRERSILGTWEADRLDSKAKTDSINLVAMFARSGFKQGRIHPVKVDITLKDLDKKEHTFSAWVVSSVDKTPFAEPFAKPGDSGSFIITGRGWTLSRSQDRILNVCKETELTVVGLLLGATVDGKLAYFIPFDAVVDEVEALTGGKVTWPVKREHD